MRKVEEDAIRRHTAASNELRGFVAVTFLIQQVLLPVPNAMADYAQVIFTWVR